MKHPHLWPGLCAVVLMLPFAAAPGHAQERGTIIGEAVAEGTGQPLDGAQVVIVGRPGGTFTGQDGRFRIPNVPAGDHQVRVVVIGYAQQTQTVTVLPGESVTADFTLRASAVELDAIQVSVLTGEAVRARELGASVRSIEVGRDVNTTAVTSFNQLLAGRSEGLVMQGVAGTVGTSQRIRIRGANSLSLSNEPLIFVDGVRVSNSVGMALGVGGQDPSRLNDLNTNDVERIEVLKGPAATALYGTAAANGVLLITTKKGTAGAATVEAFAEAGTVTDRADYPSNYFSFQQNDSNASVDDLFTAAGVLNTGAFEVCHNYQAATGNCTQTGSVSFNTMRDPRTTPISKGKRDRQGVSVRGGTEQVSYFFSGDREAERGTIFFNQIERTNVRANVNARVRDDLDIGATAFFARSDLSLNSNDNSVFSPIINGILGLPVFVAGEEGSAPFRRNFGFGWSVNDLDAFIARQDVNRANLGVNITYRPDPLGWLTTNFNAGMDFINREDSRTLQPNMLPISANNAAGTRQSQRNNNWIFTVNASASANFDLADDLTSTTTVAANYDQDRFESTQCFGVGVLPGTSSCSATSSQFAVAEGFQQQIAVAASLQQRLGWRDRLFAEGSLRVDDTNTIGFRSSVIWAPSASLSYVISEEDWFPTSFVLSTLQLRGAFGRAGVRPTNFRTALDLLAPVTVTRNATEEAAVTLNSTGNQLLKTETVTEWEGGLRLGLLDERVSLDATYFTKTSKDAIIFRQLAGSFGLTATFPDNVGEVNNEGLEFSVNALVLDRRNVRTSLNFTSTYVDNTLVEIGEGVEPIIINRGEQRHAQGYPLGSFWQPGITFEDPDGNGLLAIDDVSVGDTAVFLGRQIPKWSNTLGVQVALFDFLNVSTLFDHRSGHMTVNGTESFRCQTAQSRNDRGCRATADPTASLEQQAAFIADTFLGSAAGFIEDASFVKWRELAITLTPPPSIRARLRGISNASLTLAGRNLKTWTSFSGLDPEINEQGGSTSFNQNEFNTQPPVRTFSARLNLTF